MSSHFSLTFYKGYCKNGCCEAHGKGRVMVKWGYRDFDFINDEHNCKCPICNKYIEPVTCGFSNTKWKYKGVIKKPGCPPEKISSDWQSVDGDGYTTFKRESNIQWNSLVIRVKRP